MARPTKAQVEAREAAKLANQVSTEVKETPIAQAPTQASAENALVSALIQAIQMTKPVEKKNAGTFKSRNAFQPKEGPRAKLKRKSYQHGILLNRDNGRELLSNEEIELFNKIRPGSYCDGDIKVTRRRDKGIDVDYKIRTASQRLNLINKHGLRSFKEILARIVEEGENPSQYKKADEDFD